MKYEIFNLILLVSFLFLLTGIIGFVTLFILIRYYKSNPFCNLFLVFIITILSFRHVIHGSYYLGLQSTVKADSGIYSILYLVLAPSFYLYYKYLICPNIKHSFKDFKHLLFIVFLFLINSMESLNNSFIFYFGSFTNLFFVSVFILFYLAIIFMLLRKEIWFKKDLKLNNKHFVLVKNWTFYLYIVNVLNSTLLLTSLYTELTNGINPSGKTLGVFIMFFWLFVFFKILSSPEILFGLPILNSTLLKFNEVSLEEKEVVLELEKEANTSWLLTAETVKNNQDLKLQENIRFNIISYIKEVDKLGVEGFVFRNPKFSQSDIAAVLGVPTSHIVYLFKYHSKISFSEYRMQSRIQDAIRLTEQGFLNTETLESLAYKTGFASYNPFFISFKKITSYSPQDYIKTTKYNKGFT